MDAATPFESERWELYRLLGEPIRLRLLALSAEDELSVGELAELLGESQPNVSRHVAALRRASLVASRKQGTRVFVSLSAGLADDPVIADALRSGRAVAEADGSLAQVAAIVRARDEAVREFFAQKDADLPPEELPPELPAYLAALAPLITRRALAVDAGTGDGRLLEVLAPVFEHVVAVDREAVQLERARRRLDARGHRNVSLFEGELDDHAARTEVERRGGADAVFAARVLHHAARPKQALAALAGLLAPGGTVLVLDYAPHEDERMREQQADQWLGFEAQELRKMALAAGLECVSVRPLPPLFRGRGPDAHVPWQVLSARRPQE